MTSAAARPVDHETAAAPARSLRDLARLDRRVLTYNVAYLTGVWAVIGIVVAVAARRPRPWIVAVAVLVVAGRQHALLNVEHECIHGLFVRGRERNRRIGRWLCAAPCGSPFDAARATHLGHHRSLAQPDDPDRDLHAGPDKQTRRGLLAYVARNLAGGYALRAVVRRRGRDDEDIAGSAGSDLRSVAVVQAALWVATGPLLGWWVYPVLWAAPLATLTATFHLVRSFGEHALRPGEEEAHPERLISTRSNPVEAALLAPYNMNYHAEHHLHPYVPACRLPQVTPHLDGDERILVRRSYGRTLVDHLRALPSR